jgi:hypothetical protein
LFFNGLAFPVRDGRAGGQVPWPPVILSYTRLSAKNGSSIVTANILWFKTVGKYFAGFIVFFLVAGGVISLSQAITHSLI